MRAAVAAAAVALTVPAVVQAGTVKYRGSGGTPEVFFDVKFKHHHPRKVINLGFNTLDCGGSYAWPDPIKVKNGSFSDSRYEPIEDGITYKIKGDFVKDNAKVKGTVQANQVGADCNNKEKFAVRRIN